jgi:hypothetical protein
MLDSGWAKLTFAAGMEPIMSPRGKHRFVLAVCVALLSAGGATAYAGNTSTNTSNNSSTNTRSDPWPGNSSSNSS